METTLPSAWVSLISPALPRTPAVSAVVEPHGTKLHPQGPVSEPFKGSKEALILEGTPSKGHQLVLSGHDLLVIYFPHVS